MKNPVCSRWPAIPKLFLRLITIAGVILFLCPGCISAQEDSSQKPDPNAPLVTKVEPPSWWLKLTPELMVLLSGHHLEATRVACNLESVIVERTQATGGGDYLFVWLTIGADTKSGTAVCRVTTPTGKTSFELPLAPRAMKLGKFQGLSQEDVIYLIMPDRFAERRSHER